MHMYMIEYNMAIYAWPCVLLDRIPTFWWIITWRGVECRYMMWMEHTVEGAQLLKIKAQVSGIWAKGCVIDDHILYSILYCNGV